MDTSYVDHHPNSKYVGHIPKRMEGDRTENKIYYHIWNYGYPVFGISCGDGKYLNNTYDETNFNKGDPV